MPISAVYRGSSRFGYLPSPPATLGRRPVAKAQHVGGELLERLEIQPATCVVKVRLALDQVGEHRVDHFACGRVVVGIGRDDALRLVDQSLPFVRESDRGAGREAHARRSSSHLHKGMYATPAERVDLG